jgi:hypothetical protein
MLGDTLGICWGIGGELIGNFDENTLGTKKFKKIQHPHPTQKKII